MLPLMQLKKALASSVLLVSTLFPVFGFTQVHREATVQPLTPPLIANTYRDRGDGVLWERTVSVPGTFYIRLHFSDVVVPPVGNFMIVLRKVNGQAAERYDREQLLRLGTNFYTNFVFSDSVRVQVEGKILPQGLSFKIDRFLRHVEASGRLTPQSQVANWSNLAEIKPGSPALKLADGVSKLYIGEGFVCTGFLVGATSIITNYHCLERSFSYKTTSDNDVKLCKDVIFQFDFDRQSAPETSIMTPCIRVLDAHKNLDFALLALDSRAITRSNKSRTVLRFATERSSKKEDVFIIHHPAGLAKKISTGCETFPAAEDLTEHTCSTVGGSSGAPVMRQDGMVTALHFAGAFPEDMTVKEIEEALASGKIFRNRSKPIDLIRDRIKDFIQ